MKKKLNVLVTGAGNGVGQSIIKSLKISKFKLNIVAADINVFSSGLYVCDKSLIIPKVEDNNSRNKFVKILTDNNIDILFVGSEFEIDYFSINKNYFEKKTKTIICISDNKIIKIGNDKFETIKFLKKNHIPYPLTFVPNVKNLSKLTKLIKFPLILKDRFGTSSKNVFVIKNITELKKKVYFIKKPIIQEFLGKNNSEIFDEEYTCSFFSSIDKKIHGPFLSQRTIKYGTSWILKSIDNNQLKQLMLGISKKIDFVGSINIQLKKHKKKFIPFEINPRFSGTTCIRAALGFNEPEMYIESFFYKKNIIKKKIKKEFVMRYFEEVFIKTNQIKKLNNNFSKGYKKKWY